LKQFNGSSCLRIHGIVEAGVMSVPRSSRAIGIPAASRDSGKVDADRRTCGGRGKCFLDGC
jgi:hypothetical protein